MLVSWFPRSIPLSQNLGKLKVKPRSWKIYTYKKRKSKQNSTKLDGDESFHFMRRGSTQYASDHRCSWFLFFDRAFYNTVRERVRNHFEDTKQVTMQLRRLYIEVNVADIEIV